MTPETKMTYDLLSAPLDVTHHDVRGGVELEYITGEQCTTVLNEVLGFDAWSFRVVEHGFNVEADECWVLGELVVYMPERAVSRQQFGSQKVKRSRGSGQILDVGFDLKGAATDAMKKCASLIGVGLWLSHKEAKGAGKAPPASGVRTTAVVPVAAVQRTPPMAQPAADGRVEREGPQMTREQAVARWQRAYDASAQWNCQPKFAPREPRSDTSIGDILKKASDLEAVIAKKREPVEAAG